jgi:hypothetical protein
MIREGRLDGKKQRLPSESKQSKAKQEKRWLCLGVMLAVSAERRGVGHASKAASACRSHRSAGSM